MNRLVFASLAAVVFYSAGFLQAADRPLSGPALIGVDPSGTSASMKVVSYLARAERAEKGASTAANPAEGFIDNGDGSITDSRTGLVWLKDAGRRVASRKKAVEYCAHLSACGRSDWRLPTVKEFKTMITALRGNEQLRTMLASWGFQNVGDIYWTLIDDAPFDDFAWSIDTGFSPMTGDASKGHFVWPVRAGR